MEKKVEKKPNLLNLFIGFLKSLGKKKPKNNENKNNNNFLEEDEEKEPRDSSVVSLSQYDFTKELVLNLKNFYKILLNVKDNKELIIFFTQNFQLLSIESNVSISALKEVSEQDVIDKTDKAIEFLESYNYILSVGDILTETDIDIIQKKIQNGEDGKLVVANSKYREMVRLFKHYPNIRLPDNMSLEILIEQNTDTKILTSLRDQNASLAQEIDRLRREKQEESGRNELFKEKIQEMTVLIDDIKTEKDDQTRLLQEQLEKAKIEREEFEINIKTRLRELEDESSEYKAINKNLEVVKTRIESVVTNQKLQIEALNNKIKSGNIIDEDSERLLEDLKRKNTGLENDQRTAQERLNDSYLAVESIRRKSNKKILILSAFSLVLLIVSVIGFLFFNGSTRTVERVGTKNVELEQKNAQLTQENDYLSGIVKKEILILASKYYDLNKDEDLKNMLDDKNIELNTLVSKLEDLNKEKENKKLSISVKEKENKDLEKQYISILNQVNDQVSKNTELMKQKKDLEAQEQSIVNEIRIKMENISKLKDQLN